MYIKKPSDKRYLNELYFFQLNLYFRYITFNLCFCFIQIQKGIKLLFVRHLEYTTIVV